MTEVVQDAYQNYVERRRSQEPEPQSTVAIELTDLELAVIHMTVASERNTILFPSGLAEPEEARDAAVSALRKLESARTSLLPV